VFQDKTINYPGEVTANNQEVPLRKGM